MESVYKVSQFPDKDDEAGVDAYYAELAATIELAVKAGDVKQGSRDVTAVTDAGKAWIEAVKSAGYQSSFSYYIGKVCAIRGELQKILKERAMNPYLYDNKVGMFHGSDGGRLNEYWASYGHFLETSAEVIDERNGHRLYNRVNCYWVVTPSLEVHEYYAYNGRVAFDRIAGKQNAYPLAKIS